MVIVQSKLPSLYHRYFPNFQFWEIPTEEIATCHNCTMCRKPESAFINTKCCTYFPHLPNYLVGGILQDQRPELQEGKRRILELIKDKKGVVPYGILPSVFYSSIDSKLRKKKEGKWTSAEAESLVCPYYNYGNCTVWDYRENCCSTHFCYSVGGEFGQNFWKSLKKYLTFSENELSKYALNKIGFPIDKIDIERKKAIEYGIENESSEIDLEKYAEYWEKWAGKEVEFYIKTYEIVTQLDTESFEKIGGQNQEILLSKLTKNYQDFVHPAIPNFLVLNPKVKVKTDKNNFYEFTSDFGSVKVSPIIEKFLHLFDGKNATNIICEKLKNFNLNFEQGYLQNLYQLQILIPLTEK